MAAGEREPDGHPDTNVHAVDVDRTGDRGRQPARDQVGVRFVLDLLGDDGFDQLPIERIP